ncbi:retron St85 family effector protein [Marinobacter orientalis]|uniref:retron St85 family effector protein n=1 Tax=Marinobacter orientalis TaxID=1928859 RepID=UPI00198095D9|nr:retron St85 family effector protein [Marinobacter orientalis]
MADIRDDILLCIKVNETRLTYPLGYVFLCGGQFSLVTVEKDEDGNEREVPFLSFRDAINRRCLELSPDFARDLWNAEEFYDWLHHSNVENLIDFELDFADLSSLIVLVLEGPGAYAELGSFTALQRISPKLIVIVNQQALPHNSFVELGPLRLIQKRYPGHLLKLNWNTHFHVENGGRSVSSKLDDSEDAKQVYRNLAKDCIEAIDIEFKKNGPKLTRFDKYNNGHIALLLSELTYFFHALKLTEIILYLEYLGIKLERKKVKEIIYLLRKLNIIDTLEYMSDTFYIPGPEYVERFKFRYEEDSESIIPTKNHVVLRHAVLEYYRENDNFRYNALGLRK